MKILQLEESDEPNGVIVKAFLDKGEFRQLVGYLDNLVLFASNNINESSKAIKTGARHSYARYLLLPAKLRKSFKTDTHDFDNIRCGAIECKDSLFLIFSLNKIMMNANKNEKLDNQ